MRWPRREANEVAGACSPPPVVGLLAGSPCRAFGQQPSPSGALRRQTVPVALLSVPKSPPPLSAPALARAGSPRRFVGLVLRRCRRCLSHKCTRHLRQLRAHRPPARRRSRRTGSLARCAPAPLAPGCRPPLAHPPPLNGQIRPKGDFAAVKDS